MKWNPTDVFIAMVTVVQVNVEIIILLILIIGTYPPHQLSQFLQAKSSSQSSPFYIWLEEPLFITLFFALL